jgi:hypothetical protein
MTSANRRPPSASSAVPDGRAGLLARFAGHSIQKNHQNNERKICQKTRFFEKSKAAAVAFRRLKNFLLSPRP